jgi:hypothetical protein
MGLALNTDKLQIAQAEIDAITGGLRRPTIEDKDSLPYVHAIVKETLRWHPPLPMDIARASIEDDVYSGMLCLLMVSFLFPRIISGYFIPKNTTVIPNIWFAVAYFSMLPSLR